ncbi:hypothetical protein [Guyparkeria halopsychrophila]
MQTGASALVVADDAAGMLGLLLAESITCIHAWVIRMPRITP